MALQGVTHLRGTSQFTASEAIAVNLLVEPHTTAGQVSLCGASGMPTHIAYNAVDSGAVGEFQTICKGDVFLGLTSATVTVGDYVKAAASGQVAPEASATTRTAFTIGIAESTGTGAAAYVFVRTL